MVILRSGYQIAASENMSAVVEHLKNALVGESITRFSQSRTEDWGRVDKELAEEVEHVVIKTHESSVRAILGELLFEAAFQHWRDLVNEAFPRLNLDSVPRTDVPNFLRFARRKLVLLLGKDTGRGLARLRKIRKVIESRAYDCQLIKDLPEHPEMGLITKVLFSALAARFVVIENSAQSGHLYELPFVRMAECVVAILQHDGQGATWMTEDMIAKHGLLKKFTYRQESLASCVEEAIDWAEQRVAENVEANKNAWPWAR
jgi:hypothetical protein